MSTTKFPRGGSLDQGNSNKRKVEDDALFGSKRLKRIEVSNNKTNKNKLNKKNTEKSITIQPTLNQSLTSVGLGMVKSSGINNDYARVDHLSKSKYVVGTQAIGYILTVTKKFIVLSLPGGVTGIVLPQEISDYYHQLYLNGSDEFHMNVDTILEQNGIIHQPLICISLGIEDKSDDNKNPHLLLSLRGSLINKTLTLKNLYVDFPLVGCISSIEDIGYIISTGIIGITAFLPKNNVPSDIGELRLGQRIDCVISSINEIARTVTLTAKHKAVKETIVDNMSISFNSIRAGMLFNVRITSFVENGLLVSFLESFNGAIDIFSLSRPYSSKEIRSKYKKDELLISRIVFIDHSNKSVRLSIRPHIIDYKPPVALPSLGEIIENLEVKYAHKYVGLILTNMQTSEDDTIEKNAELVESALKPEDANTKVKKINKKQLKLQLKQEREEDELIPGYYINRSSLNDPKTNKPLDRNENVLDHYPLSTIISQAKVTGYFLVEGYGSATNLYDYVTNDITHNSQLKVGQIISGTVVSIQATGLNIKLLKNYHAFCPIQHTSDVAITNTESNNVIKKLKGKFRINQKINVLIWEMTKSVIVTYKKSLITAADRILATLDQIVVGNFYIGVVSKLSDKQGIRIHFCDGFFGYISTDVLMKQGVYDVNSYYIGQSVECVVIDYVEATNSSNYRIKLALNIGDTNDFLSDTLKPVEKSHIHSDSHTKVIATNNQHKLELVNGTIIRINEGMVIVRLDDNRIANLKKHHCTDFAFLSDYIFDNLSNQSYYKIGDRIENAIIISKFKDEIYITTKKLLTIISNDLLTCDSNAIADTFFPNSISDLLPGQIVVGVVSKIEIFGLFIKFRDNLQALAPRSNLMDKFTSTAVGLYNIGDSIRCIVQRIDLQSQRIIVSLKPSLVTPSYSEYNFLYRYLIENHVYMTASSNSKIMPNYKKYPLGSYIEATITSIKDYGVLLLANDNVSICLAYFSDTNTADSNRYKINKKVKIQILNINFEKHIFEVEIADNSIVISNDNGLVFNINDVLDCLIVLVKDKYLISSYNNEIIYVMYSDYHSPYLLVDSTIYKPSDIIQVKVVKLKSKTESSSPFDNIVIGSILTNTTKEQLKQRNLAKQLLIDAQLYDNKISDKFQVYTQVDDIHVGSILEWVIESISTKELKVTPINNIFQNYNKIKAIIPLANSLDRDVYIDTFQYDLDQPVTTINGMDSRHPFSNYSKGQKINCRITKLVEEQPRTGSAELVVHLNIAHIEDKILPFRPYLRLSEKEYFKLNHIYTGIITEITPTGVRVELSEQIHSIISYMDISNDLKTIRKFVKNCYVGQKLNLGIVSIQKFTVVVTRAGIEHILNSSNDVNSLSKPIKINMEMVNKYKKGSLVWGVVDLKPNHSSNNPVIIIRFANKISGRIDLTELYDKSDWIDLQDVFKNIRKLSNLHLLPNSIKHGNLIKVRILSIVKDSNMMDLSIRTSRLLIQKKSLAVAPDTEPNVNDVVKGYVINITTNGCFVKLSSSLVALVYLKDLSDTYVTNPSHDFPNGKLVTGRVISKTLSNDSESFKYQLSLKYSIVQGNEDLKKEILKLVIGNIVIGTVSKVKEFGVFVDIKDTKVTGLSRINDAVDNATLDLREVYTVGDIVRAKILSVDTVHNKVSLGLKTRYFKNDDMNDDEDNTNDDVEIDDIADEDTNELQLDNHDELDYDEAVDNRKFGDNDRILEPIDYTSDDDDIERLIQSANIDNSYDIDIDDDEKEETTIANKRKISLVDDDEDIDSDVETSTTLFTKKLFANKSYNDANNLIVWDDFNKLSSNNKDEDSNSDSDNYDDTSITITNTKRSRQKDNKKRKEEETIRSKELQLTKGSTLPESSNDFERLLISQPNSSYIWIQYMTFYLKSANINEAREVAERALKSILFREEDEKFNVWIAYINMEYKFGTTDTLEKVFKRAVNESKGKYIYLSMAQSYEQNNHISEAEDIYNKALKKYKYSKKIWISYQSFHINNKNLVKSKELLDRSLLSLSKHKHIEVILKYIQNLYNNSYTDEGRLMYEELISNNPKRSDIWYTYVDKETKIKNYNNVRILYERLLNNKFYNKNIKNMKLLFKKYLEFELKHGTADTQDNVKQKAKDFVSNIV